MGIREDRAMCLSAGEKPERTAAMTAVLSSCEIISTGLPSARLISSSAGIASLLRLVLKLYVSASHVLLAVIVCFLLPQQRAHDRSGLVLLRSSIQRPLVDLVLA